MDSCNSGDVDFVSSSADEDYEDSSFASPPPPQPLPPLPPGLVHSSSSSFDSLASYHLNSFVSSSNLDAVWSRKRSSSSPLSPPPCLSGVTIPNSGDAGSIFSRPLEGLQPAPAAPKSGKKRSRASRRAPTTVLTTDTSNFRQMVQEFTGIPTPPFGSASPFSRGPRLDLLGGSGAMLPPFLLRSFQQKSPIITHLANDGNTSSNNNSGNLNLAPSSNAANSAGLTESLPEFSSGNPPTAGFPDSLLNLQSQMNSATKFQFPSFLPGKPPTPGLPLLPDSILPMNVGTGILMDEHGSNSYNVEPGGQHNVSTQITNGVNISAAPIPSVDPSRMLFMGGMSGSAGGEDEVGSQQPCSFTVESNPLKGGGSCKINYGTSSAEFIHAERGSETGSRGEGVVESWIPSSYIPSTTTDSHPFTTKNLRFHPA